MTRMISRNWVFSLYILLLFSGSFFSPASAKPRANFVSGIASNAVSALFKRLWSLKPTNKIGFAIPRSRSMIKFEDGYSVETVFDGSKLGIEPYSVEVAPSGELLVLDSQNSNIHKIAIPFSRYSVPKFVAGSSGGYSGHVDGKPREARMNHPKGLTVDDRGNIYVADTKNMAIRKISDTGVVTIAGGTWTQIPGHVDDPSNNVKFSNDFDVIYVASTCSILVIDRGNQAIQEIQLHDDDCSYKHYDGNPHLGIAVLSAAVFFGFMLALLQRRISAMFSSSTDPGSPKKSDHEAAYQMPIKSVRPPLIPPEDDGHEKDEEGFFDSLGKLFTNTGSSLFDMFSGIFSSSKQKPLNAHQMAYQQPPPYFNTWPMQERFMIPPTQTLEARDPTTRKTYKFSTNPKKHRYSKQSQYIYHGHTDYFHHQHQIRQLQQQHHQMHYLSGPQTYYEENNKTTNEIVFGAVQEDDGAMMVNAVDYSNPSCSIQKNLRSRCNYMDYAYDMY